MIGNDAIVTPSRIEKAKRTNPAGVKRLALFVNSTTYNSYDIFCACNRERANDLELRRHRITLMKHGRQEREGS